MMDGWICQSHCCNASSDTDISIHPSIIPSIIYLSKASKHMKRANQLKTYNIGLDIKANEGLLDCLHVAHKIILKFK